MQTYQKSDFSEDLIPPGCIGLWATDSQVTVFMPGDESTPEWQALHPPYEPQEDESLNT